jgi:hypothetical protein
MSTDLPPDVVLPLLRFLVTARPPPSRVIRPATPQTGDACQSPSRLVG